MREAAARGPSIDISEFERRLRGAKSSDDKRAADPLAELARLLHSDETAQQPTDPYRQVFAAADPAARAEQPARVAAAHPVPPPNAAVRHDDFRASGLRGSLSSSPAAEERSPSHYGTGQGQAPAADWSHPESQDYLDYGVEPDEDGRFPNEELPKGVFGKARSKLRPWHAVLGVVTIGAVSVGWSLAHRGGVVGPREIATINAPEGPAKIQPSAAVDAAAPQRGAAILDRNQSAPVKKVVSHEEQPVDPAAALRVVRLGDAPVDAPHEAAQGGLAPSFVSEPKRVKTVSVRPDGTVIERDAPPPAIVRPSPTLTPPPVRPATLGLNPRAGEEENAAPPTATPGSPAKPATTPRAAQQARPKPVAPVAQNPATEEVAAEQTAAADASAMEDPAQTASTGAFAVQFGAAGSEAEARQLIQRVATKYNAQLGGRRLGYRLAKIGEKSVYRVRVAGMSREQAVGVCEKVKAAGGNCFVAAN